MTLWPRCAVNGNKRKVQAMTNEEQRQIIGQVMLDLEADMRSLQHALRAREPVSHSVPEIPSKEGVQALISDIHAARDEVLRLEGERDRLGV